jgi:hypothetical protein
MARAFDELAIDEPCGESWEAMPGDETARHCARCDREVHDLSAMAREDAQRLVDGADGPLCVRFRRREDGTLASRERSRGVARWIAGLSGAVLSLQVIGSARADLSVEDKKKANRDRGSHKAKPAPPPVGEVVDAPVALPAQAPAIMGSISREAVRPPTEAVRACYERALRANPHVEGRLSLKFKIENGAVTEAEIVSSTLEDPVVEQCVLDVAKKWHFPTSASPVTVTYPFVFTPSR